ncbi:MAG: stage II sporulation protein M [Thermoleophilia bacterium]|nr:stage II sporulation protein M [Thermoleophilia bacterium]
MRVADRLSSREQTWRELDQLLGALDAKPMRRATVAEVLRLGELYRAACTDLMLAESHDLPRDTVAYLHGLVGRAHNAVYRAKGFRFNDWGASLFGEVPRRLRTDPALRIAVLAFWGSFLLCALLAAGRPGFSKQVIGDFAEQMEDMYAEPIEKAAEKGGRSDSMMAGFYIQHNTSIGLQCFAWGLFVGLGSLYQLVSNGVILGTVFGHMATSPHAGNFYTFVTAHGPFELTAIVLSGAAGLRLGWGLIDTQGQTRVASLRREAANALPTVGAAVVLFILAAFIEGFVSASPIPYSAKAGIAIASTLLLLVYIGLGGRTRKAPSPVPAAAGRVA